MPLRVDIDESDLKSVTRETQPRLSAATVSFFAVLTFLCFTCLGAGYAAFVGVGGFIESGAAFTPRGLLTPATLTLLALTGAGGFVAVIQERKRLREGEAKDRVKHGLTTGRFEFHFTDAFLIVKGPLATRKVRWGTLNRIEETKNNIVFWRRGRPYAFIPTNSLKDKGFYERLQRVHGPAIENKLSFDKDQEANPHAVTFEWRKNDLQEYSAIYEARFDGRLSFLRAIGEWRPWRPILFALAIQLSIGAGVIGVLSASVAAMAIAFGAAALAISIFFLDADYFRGPAHPLKRDKEWPFAQSEIITVTLADAGVFIHRAGGDEIYAWPLVSSLVERPLGAYLVLSPRVVFPLPRRSFSNRVHYTSFVNFARSNIDGAKNAVAAKSGDRVARTLGAVRKKKAAKTPAAPQQTPAPTNAPSPAALRAALNGTKGRRRRAAR